MADFKSGLDYYSHYIGMTKDSKLRKIRKKYGSVGVDVWLAVLDLIYSDKGYYIAYGNEDEIDDVTWKVSDYVKGKYAPDVTTVEEIIGGDLFKLGILSSKRVQLQYYASTVERKAVEVTPEYWLISVSEMKKVSERSSILRQFSNRLNIGDNQPICDDNRPISNQSKVNQSKVNLSEVKPAAAPHSAPHTKEILIEEFGADNVSEYERRFDNWVSSKGGNIRPQKYVTIEKWMRQDGIKKTSSDGSAFNAGEVMSQTVRNYNLEGNDAENS